MDRPTNGIVKAKPYMKNKTSSKDHPRKQMINTIRTVSILILAPLIGLFLLPRKTLKWKLPVKFTVGILTVIYLPIHAIFFLYFLYAGGNIQPFLPQDQFAQTYLQNRYHEEFTIGRVSGSDELGGSITYRKYAHPKDNPSLEFSISKCLARCNGNSSTEFSDTYPQKKWTQQLTERFKRDLALNSKQTINTYANTEKGTEIVNAHKGSIPDFYQLSSEERQQIGISASYYEKDGSYTLETREQHAKQILKIISLLRETGAKVGSLTYDIQAMTPGTAVSKHSRDKFHFTSDQPLTLTSPNEIYPLFVVFTYGRGIVKDGYQAQQTQLNDSRGQSTGGKKPDAAAISKAKKELGIASDIRNQIAVDYLVAPYVTTAITLNDSTVPTTDFSTLPSAGYTVNVSVYNYPNDTIPVSATMHRDNVVALTQLLKKKFTHATLSYKTDFSVCNVEVIDPQTVSENTAVDCFKN